MDDVLLGLESRLSLDDILRYRRLAYDVIQKSPTLSAQAKYAGQSRLREQQSTIAALGSWVAAAFNRRGSSSASGLPVKSPSALSDTRLQELSL